MQHHLLCCCWSSHSDSPAPPGTLSASLCVKPLPSPARNSAFMKVECPPSFPPADDCRTRKLSGSDQSDECRFYQISSAANHIMETQAVSSICSLPPFVTIYLMKITFEYVLPSQCVHWAASGKIQEKHKSRHVPFFLNSYCSSLCRRKPWADLMRRHPCNICSFLTSV